MSKKMKVLVSVLVAVLVLSIGGTAVALADDEEESVLSDNTTGLLARIADILDIPEEDLLDAFKEARQEMAEGRWEAGFEEALAGALAEGLITEAEAGEIREWWEQRPEVLEPGLLRGAFGFGNQDCAQLPGVKRGMRPEIRQRLAQKFMERAANGECPIFNESGAAGQGWPQRMQKGARPFAGARGFATQG